MSSPAGRRNRAVIGRVVSGAETSRGFAGAWIAADAGKAVVPLPAHRGLSPMATARAIGGAREVGATGAWVVSFDARLADDDVVQSPLDAGQLWRLASQDSADTAPLLLADNLLGGVLSRPGHVLVAGTADFVRGAVPEGADEARARFRRYAERLRDAVPELIRIADLHPALNRAWATTAEVPATSHTGRQLALMDGLVRRSLDGATFANRWLTARRAARDSGERVRDGIQSVLDDVFYALEDDLTEADLRRRVATALNALRRYP
ncbi:hypothetical protein ACFT9I_10110 [Streptomyces sp. NPDC057137]|uniref:hypothetical protein n=1 Tax=Streptomyces sp. NPDC057137 TaxID=3346030 RepID=UPI003641E1AC